MTAERELWVAVLMQAVYDLFGFHAMAPVPNRQLIRSDAETWLLSDAAALGSFRWICNSLDLDPATVRRRVFSLSVMQLRERIQNQPIEHPRILDSEPGPIHKIHREPDPFCISPVASNSHRSQ